MWKYFFDRFNKIFREKLDEGFFTDCWERGCEMKKFIDDKEALDAEIPSDDDEEESSDEKELKKGLSRRELSIMKSLNK